MPPEEESGLDLRDSMAVLRRRKWSIALCAAGAVALALLLSFLQTPVYQATAKVLLQQRLTDSLFETGAAFVSDPTRAINTEIQVLESEPVQTAVREEFGGSAPSVSAHPVGETDVIAVNAQSTKPATAARVANAYAKAYTDFRRKQAVDDLLAASGQIQTRVTELQGQIDALDRRVDEAPAGAQAGLRADVTPLKEQLLLQQGTFKQQLDQMRVNADLTTGRAQLVAPATEPSKPIKPTPVRNAQLALVLGLVIGVGVAFLREHLDDSVTTKDDLAQASGGLPVVGLIPAVAGWKERGTPKTISIDNPRSPATEAYRTLRTSIQFLSLDGPMRTLQVTSPGAQEGKSTTLANLGVALAATGQRVIIMCCDLRRPRVHEFFGLDNKVGLTSVLAGDAPLSSAVQAVPNTPRLSILASGPLPPNPAEVLAAQRTGDVITALQAQTDLVLIDSPPVLPVTDALVIAGRVDATLMTCYAGVTTGKEIARATELLHQVEARLVGTVLNGVKSDGRYGYGYYYRRYYGPDVAELAAVNGENGKNSKTERNGHTRRKKRSGAAAKSHRSQ